MIVRIERFIKYPIVIITDKMDSHFNWRHVIAAHDLVVVDPSAMWYSFREDMSDEERAEFAARRLVPDSHFEKFIGYLEVMAELLEKNNNLAVTPESKREFASFRESLEKHVVKVPLRSDVGKAEQFHPVMCALEKAVEGAVFQMPERAYRALHSYFGPILERGFDLTEADVSNIVAAIAYNGDTALVTNDSSQVNAALFALRCTNSEHFGKRFRLGEKAYQPTPVSVYSFSRGDNPGYTLQTELRPVRRKRVRSGQPGWGDSALNQGEASKLIEAARNIGWIAEPTKWGARLVRPPSEALLTAEVTIVKNPGGDMHYSGTLFDNTGGSIRRWNLGSSLKMGDVMHALIGLVTPYMTGKLDGREITDPGILKVHRKYKLPG
ncbi:hypothetical protein KY360_02560 [Candidatus Woesearchaeota archaeon]|nr:hypothetical protein [Candidatus Woesearchaeota archaeon]